MAAIHVKPVLFKEEQVAVIDEGENVAVTIGDTTWRFHYEDALKLSQWIRLRAKQAKRRAGDVSRHWSAVGTLDALEG